jgi:hypothetical protein
MSDLLRQFGSAAARAGRLQRRAGAGRRLPLRAGDPRDDAYVARILALLDGAGAILAPPFEVRLVA